MQNAHFPLLDKAINGYMVKRKEKYGSFYGYSHFPTCRSTEEVEEEFCH